MESHLVTVAVRPTPAALMRVVCVLHTRKADVSRLTYDGAEVVVEVQGPGIDRLAAQLGRLVDVLHVVVAATTATEAPLAVAS